MLNAIIIPGNGNTDINENWFPYVKRELQMLGLEVRAKNMPDPQLARAQFWLPFIKNELYADENSILIGHSSGAVAIMRYLENHKVRGVILVGACYTDLDNDSEKASGYYNEPWQWEKIQANAEWIVQFASTDDPFIPISEARYIHQNLDSDYREYTDQGHFGGDRNKTEFPEIVIVIKKKIELVNKDNCSALV